MAVSAASRPGLQRPALAFSVTSIDHTVAIFVGVQLDHALACFVKTLKQEAIAARGSPCIDHVLARLRLDPQLAIAGGAGPCIDHILARLRINLLVFCRQVGVLDRLDGKVSISLRNQVLQHPQAHLLVVWKSAHTQTQGSDPEVVLPHLLM